MEGCVVKNDLNLVCFRLSFKSRVLAIRIRVLSFTRCCLTMAPKTSKPVVEQEETVAPSSVEIAVPPVEGEVPSSDGGDDTSSSEGEGTDVEEGSPHSRDGDDRTDGDGEGGGDDTGSASAGVEVPSSSIDKPKKIVPEEDYDDKEFEKILEAFVRAKKDNGKLDDDFNIADVIEFEKICQQRSQYYWNMKVEVGVSKRKIEKFLREQQKKEKPKETKPTYEPAVITLNIRLTDGRNFPLRISVDETIKGLRDEFYKNNKKVLTKKAMKDMKWMRGDDDVNSRPRRQVGSGQKDQSGWRLRDGDTITLMPRGQGGGKRGRGSQDGRPSKDDKTRSKFLEFQMGVAQIANLGMPDLNTNKTFLTQSVAGISKDTFENAIREVSVDKAKAIVKFLFSTNNENSRVDFIAKTLCEDYTTIALTRWRHSHLCFRRRVVQ